MCLDLLASVLDYISKRHLSRQFSRFLRHALCLGLQADNLFLQLFLLRGGDGVDHGGVFLGEQEDFVIRASVS